jgi:hypothetical protein
MIVVTLAATSLAPAGTTVFFQASQTTNLVSSGTTSDTISSEGYLFTVTRDKLFTGGIGLPDPIGRAVRVPWPAGLEAQAVTSGPVLSKARIDITRQDGQPFAITSFTGQLLANTAGAGGAFEIMPMVNGEDAAANPFTYNASGYTGSTFTYATPELAGFDSYKLTLYVDYAVMSLTVVDASQPPPALEIQPAGAGLVQLSWPVTATGFRLESIASPAGVLWAPVTNDVVTIGEFFTVEVPADESQRLFRLRQQ